MAEISALLTAFGLSASAGLNAYIPLLLIGFTARLWPEVLRLSAPFDILTSGWVLGLLTVLLLVESLADKIPVVDHMNDALGLIVRPAAGAVLFASAAGTVEFLDPGIALALGLVVAGTTHGAKATARPVVTATTGGLGNPLVSTLEDIVALLTSVVAILAPFLIGAGLVAFGILVLAWRGRRSAGGPPPPLDVAPKASGPAGSLS